MSRYGIPEIFESEADGMVKDIYNDIKYVLRVPVVNFVFRALAVYPEFLAEAWAQVRPSMLTIDMENKANDLRHPKITFPLYPISLMNEYDLNAVNQIKKELFIFRYVNPKLLLIASAWAESLSNRPILGRKQATGFIRPGVDKNLPAVQLVHVSHASPPIQKIFYDIMEKHHSFDVASDFRAFAKFPKFLADSWNQLRHYVGTEEYNKNHDYLKEMSISYVHQEMPYPVTINRRMMEKQYSPDQIAGVIGLVSLFQNFLPNLIANSEFLRLLTHS